MKDLETATKYLGSEESLKWHLTGNFYPPFPSSVKNRVITMFKAYWRNRINFELLMKYITKKFVNEDGFYRYQFDFYLKDEDKEFDY